MDESSKKESTIIDAHTATDSVPFAGKIFRMKQESFLTTDDNEQNENEEWKEKNERIKKKHTKNFKWKRQKKKRAHKS